jgi:23S rRNA (uracil1939-C5)-methyltransferase
VVAVEENAQAVEDGEASRAFNAIPDAQCRFVRARVEALAHGGRQRGLPDHPDLVLLDPPRQGCPREVLDWICRVLQPARVVYVSCNPEALAGDLAATFQAGYHAEVVQPIDMFPHTPHLETVAVLTPASGR